MSKLEFISAVVLSMSISTASAHIVWNADQWDAYSSANRFTQAQTEVSDNQLVITHNWSEGEMATALHNNIPMVYAPSQSLVIFKVKTDGILFSDLKGAQVEIAHAYKADAPEGAPNFYTDKVNCTKTTKNGDGDNVGYFYVDMSDNLAKKGIIKVLSETGDKTFKVAIN